MQHRLSVLIKRDRVCIFRVQISLEYIFWVPIIFDIYEYKASMLPGVKFTLKYPTSNKEGSSVGTVRLQQTH